MKRWMIIVMEPSLQLGIEALNTRMQGTSKQP
jgi:hypothetical protein